MIMLNAPLVGSRLGYPDLSGLDLLELYAFVHPARFAVPTPKGIAHALGLAEPAGDDDAAAFLREAAARLLATLEADWPERGGAWASAQALWRLRWPWAGAVAERLQRARARRALAVLEAARMGGERRPPAAAADPARPRRHVGPARAAGRRAMPRRGRASATMPPPPPPSSRRGRSRTSPICCSPRPAPGSARRLAISPPPRSGPSRPTARSGSRPTPRRCSASSTARAPACSPTRPSGKQEDRHPQGPRELSLPAEPRGRAARAASPAAPRSSPSWSRAGPLIRRTATWSAAICRAG